MSKVKVGIIGCGAISQRRHVPEYARNPDAELAAFCDPVIERAQALADQHGGRAYADYQEMLQKEDLDAVSVCTPNVLHAPISIAAARAKKHVLCEKPMATTTEDAAAMIQAAEENGVKLMIGHNQRFMPAHAKGKEILDSGRMGKVLTFRTAFGHPGPEGWSVEGKEGWFFQKSKAYVGAMGDLGVHKADLIRYLLQDEVAEVGAFIETIDKTDTDVDDNAVCVFKMKGGAVGTMSASWTNYGKEDNGTVLFCEKGVLKLGIDPEYQVIIEPSGGEVEKLKVGAMATNEKQVSSGVIDRFIEAVTTNQATAVPGEEGKRSLDVILACMQSAEQEKLVRIKP